MNFKYLILFLYLFFLIFVVCSCNKIENVDIILETGIKPQVTSNSDLNLNIYLDSTYSMKGYTTMDIETEYIKTITSISTIANTISKSGDTKYYTFKEKTSGNIEIADISLSEYNKAKNENFYNVSETYISSIIKKIPKSKNFLNIIITDLIEEDSNYNTWFNEMKKITNMNEFSIGILGIKSYFNGIVYDIGRNSSGKTCHSLEGNLNTYRPFYIVFIGNNDDIINMYENLHSICLDELPQNSFYFEIFSKQLISKNINNDVVYESLRRIRKNNQIINNDDRLENLIAVKGIDKKNKENEKLVSDIKILPIKYTRLYYALDINDGLLDINKKDFLDVSFDIQNCELGQEKINLDKCMKQPNIVAHPNGLKIESELYPYNLQNGNYLISLGIMYKHKEIGTIIPKKWDMMDENDPYYYSKTYNLSNIIQGIYNIIYSSNTDKLELGKVYYSLLVKD